MRENILILSLLLSFSFLSFSQNEIFSENKVGEYSGKIIRRTEWKVLKTGAVHMYYSRLNQIDNKFILDLKILMNRFVSVEENADFVIKFSDDSIMILKNNNHITASIGQGAIGITGSKILGINPQFIISKEQLEILAKKKIIYIRLYLNDGYMETNVKSKRAEIFKDHCVELYIRAYPS